jgi:hypothetical protein
MRKLWVLWTALAVLSISVACCAAGEAGERVSYKKYTDKKFGFSIDYPDFFTESDAYVGEDGMSTFEARTAGENGDGKHHVIVSGGKRPKGADGNSLLKEATDMKEDKFGYVNGVEPLPGTVRSGVDFYALEYATDRTGGVSIVHRYCLVGKKTTVTYELCYPREEAERFSEIQRHMDASLKVTN